jgi:hypothetical protein
MTTKKAAAKSTSGSRKAARSRASERERLDPLALELFAIVSNALKQYGVSPLRQRTLFERVLRGAPVTPTSGPMLDQFRGLSDLIAAWLEGTAYVDAAGRPKVLAIEGRGATFASLARKFLPEKAVAEVVKLACDTTNVGTLPNGKIALYGDQMVNFSRDEQSALAQTICHVKRLFDTCLHNVQIARDDAPGARLERMVAHVISATDFNAFQRAIRPQLHNLCEYADTLLKSSAGRPRGKLQRGTAGIGLYVYYDDSIDRDSDVTRGKNPRQEARPVGGPKR